MNKSLTKSLNRTAADEASLNADQLEVDALIEGRGSAVSADSALSDENLSEELWEQSPSESDLDDESIEDEDAFEEAMEEDVEEEEKLANMSLILQERERLLGEYYPFKFNNNSLTYIGSKTLTYEMCLAISTADNIAKDEYKAVRCSFERLAGIAMKLLLGRGAKYLRVGHPPEVESDPNTIRDASKILRRRTGGDWGWSPMSDGSVNDGGIDIVVWKRPDDRRGSIMFLGNCACGKSWKGGKKGDRPSAKANKWVRTTGVSGVIDFLGVPFHVVNRDLWLDACMAGGFVLDRIRLTKVFEQFARKGRALLGSDLTSSLEQLIRTLRDESKPYKKRLR